MADYYYAGARIRALETAFLGREKWESLLESKSREERLSLLSEYGIPPRIDRESGTFLREETLLARLRSAYDELAELDPDGKATRLWLYPYDCNNIKAALKAFVRETDPASMLFDFGTIPTEDVQNAIRSGDYRALGDFAEATKEAAAAFEKTKNPQRIDLILDKACYREMLRLAEESGVAFAISLVRTRIDLLNVMIAIRVLRMKQGDVGMLFLRDAFLEGGLLDAGTLLSAAAAGEGELLERLAYSEYADFAKAAKENAALSAMERAADDAFMRRVKEAKMICSGPEVLIGYLLGYETEVKNLRILLSSKDAGLSTDIIRERMRENYV